MGDKRNIWVLTTTNEKQPLGEKATVSLHRNLEDARREMDADMKAVLALRGLTLADVEREYDSDFAQTKDFQHCWHIESMEV